MSDEKTTIQPTPKKRSKIPIVIGGVIAVGLLAAFGFRVSESKERNKAAVAAAEKEVITTVRTSQASRKDLPRVVQITGSIKALNEVQILPKSPGRVTRVLVDVGAVVKAGEVLAAVESVDMGLRVKQADAQLRQAQAGLEQAKVQAQTAEKAFKRISSLKEKGAVSQTEFEQAESGHLLAKVGIQGAEAAVSLAEANLGLSQKAFDDTRITTPVAGIVTKKNVNIGTMANPAQVAFAVQDQSALKMDGGVPSNYVSQLKVGMKVSIVVDELPGRSFEGSISRLAPTLEQETRRAALEIALEPSEGLLPYMFGRAEIAFGSTDDVLVVPSAAVLSIGGQPAIYVVQKDHAKLVRPEVGAKHQDDVVIEGGLDAGDVVVISGNSGLKDGARIIVQGT